MHFLIDENLPSGLGESLKIDYTHASAVCLQASDSILWQAARENEWIIVTRDTDFFNRLVLFGAPPKVVWIRLGNLRRSDLIDKIMKEWPAITALLKENDLIQLYPDYMETMRFDR